MDFRPTSAKTSGEKNFRKKFYWLKRTAFEFHGDSLGVIFTFGYIKWPKITKNTPLDFKIQKKTQLLTYLHFGRPHSKHVINIDNLSPKSKSSSTSSHQHHDVTNITVIKSGRQFENIKMVVRKFNLVRDC